MRPDWQAAIVGLTMIVALLAVGILLGVAVAQWAPALYVSPVACMSTVCEVAECRVEHCERTVEVKVLVPTLQCGRDELVLTGMDDNGFPIAQCVKVIREGVNR